MELIKLLSIFAIVFSIWSFINSKQEQERQARELREFADKIRNVASELIAGNLPFGGGSGKAPPVPDLSAANAELMQAFEALLQREGRRSFWSGFAQNAFFFVLGVVASAIMK